MHYVPNHWLILCSPTPTIYSSSKDSEVWCTLSTCRSPFAVKISLLLNSAFLFCVCWRQSDWRLMSLYTYYRLVRLTPKYLWAHIKMPAAWHQRGKQTALMKPSQDVKAAASELHLCQFFYTDNPKRKTAAKPDFCFGYTCDEGRKLNFLPIDYTGWWFQKSTANLE